MYVPVYLSKKETEKRKGRYSVIVKLSVDESKLPQLYEQEGPLYKFQQPTGEGILQCRGYHSQIVEVPPEYRFDLLHQRANEIRQSRRNPLTTIIFSEPDEGIPDELDKEGIPLNCRKHSSYIIIPGCSTQDPIIMNLEVSLGLRGLQYEMADYHLERKEGF